MIWELIRAAQGWYQDLRCGRWDLALDYTDNSGNLWRNVKLVDGRSEAVVFEASYGTDLEFEAQARLIKDDPDAFVLSLRL